MIGLAQPVQRAGAVAQQQRQPDNGESRQGGSQPRSAGIESGLPPTPTKVIGVICSGNVAAERDQVKQLVARGLEQEDNAVWVCLEPKSDHMTHDVMLALGIEPVVLPLVDAWRVKHDEHGYDLRRTWRDQEMLHLCDMLIVFHKRTGSSPWRERADSGLYEGRLFVVDIGPEPKRTRKTRKPVGA